MVDSEGLIIFAMKLEWTSKMEQPKIIDNITERVVDDLRARLTAGSSP